MLSSTIQSGIEGTTLRSTDEIFGETQTDPIPNFFGTLFGLTKDLYGYYQIMPAAALSYTLSAK